YVTAPTYFSQFSRNPPDLHSFPTRRSSDLCQEEVHCTDENGSTRFIDIVAIDPNSSQAFMVDPTIRYETNSDIGKEVQEEKERRSEEHTSELQSRFDLVCRLLLEKKNTSTN